MSQVKRQIRDENFLWKFYHNIGQCRGVGAGVGGGGGDKLR